MTVTQPCVRSGCEGRLTYQSDTTVGADVACNGEAAHPLLVAECPAGFCPTGRFAIPKTSRVGRVLHHQECKSDVVVATTKPLPTLRVLT